MDTPSVSVIIPVRNDRRLSDCLAALDRQTYPAERVEVIVADNGSTVPPNLGDFPRARLVLEADGGSYTARNAAVAASTGMVLAFTDSDCLPEPEWLEKSVAALRGGAGLVAGRVQVYVRDERRPHPIEAYELVHAFPQRTYVARGGASVTANLVTTRAVFDSVGPFRTELLSGADVEWSQRANACGFATVYCHDVVVRHPARSSFAAMHTKLRRVIEGRRHRDVLDGARGAMPWPPARSLVPPLGAFGRAARAQRLRSPRARAALVVGEFFHRYVGAWVAFEIALSERLRRTQPR